MVWLDLQNLTIQWLRGSSIATCTCRNKFEAPHQPVWSICQLFTNLISIYHIFTPILGGYHAFDKFFHIPLRLHHNVSKCNTFDILLISFASKRLRKSNVKRKKD